ncbi:MAG: zinc ribbon domain-containing protein [Acidobacteriota bacterium]|nr:zinc ribbon domain-containing protein [Acidobacteriota bacterium]
MSSNTVCAACRHSIDEAAKICPYCGSDPRTGRKIVDTQAILQEVFHPREVSAAEGVMQYARQRQGIVITFAVILAFVALSGFNQFVLRRNRTVVSEAVPLTDVADLSNQPDETRALPMPDLKFQYDGNPQTMRSFIIESGAVAPAAPPAPAPTTTQ